MRGHSKIRKRQCLRAIKKYSFPHRTVDVWNGLSEEIVTAAASVCRNLRKCWINIDIETGQYEPCLSPV